MTMSRGEGCCDHVPWVEGGCCDHVWGGVVTMSRGEGGVVHLVPGGGVL